MYWDWGLVMSWVDVFTLPYLFVLIVIWNAFSKFTLLPYRSPLREALFLRHRSVVIHCIHREKGLEKVPIKQYE